MRRKPSIRKNTTEKFHKKRQKREVKRIERPRMQKAQREIRTSLKHNYKKRRKG